jgi:hypothetical protein
MRTLAKKMFKSPRWLIFFISLGMVTVGYCGLKLFEFASNLHHEKTAVNNDTLLAVACFFLMLAGVIVGVLSFGWIVISAALCYVRRFESEHSRQH